jgi:hypothetical protein
MGNVRVLASLRNSRLNLIRDAIDASSGAGTIKVYNGTQPANADAGLSGNTLLATLTFTDPSAPNASGGVLTFSTVTEDSSADASGTASWARIADSAGNTVFDCDVGASGSGATLIINNVAVTLGGPVRMTSFTLTEPGA